ncbi:MAG TPA: single-stranded-DNA-specific exonuclease RecJ [Desulfobacteraceae bacterium]|nr:single-stranded-DNA-specific exonuclease RecJ [Desulfobacteraceae bacterium]
MHSAWRIQPCDEAAAGRLAAALSLPLELARILVQRGIGDTETARAFLDPALDQLPLPESLDGLTPAAARLAEAVTAGQRILVFGDYDADGVTATALLTDFLQEAGASVTAYIPDRHQEGYGLQPRHIVDPAEAAGCRLIVTVDCGAASHAAVAEARRRGIDVVVTDHHLPHADELPAVAVVNPRQGLPDAPLAPLAGVGVAFYLAAGLRAHLRRLDWWNRRPEPNLRQACDLVALGTVADMVPLVGVNRVLTHAGLAVLREARRPGLEALMAVSAVSPPDLDSQDIAFRLAPRLNAAGRLAHARLALDLLRCPDPVQARQLAQRLDDLNRQRRCLEADIFAEAVDRLKREGTGPLPRILVLAEDSWHEGVIGIVAGRLARCYHRPAVVLTRRGDRWKGSARSVEGLDICAVFRAAAQHLCAFGGHPMAAGLQLEAGRLAAFSRDLQAAVDRLAPQLGAPPPLAIDGELDLDRITPAFLDALAGLEPFGSANPRPLFAARRLAVCDWRTVGRSHLRMTLCQADRPAARQVDAIRFNAPADSPPGPCLPRAAFRLGWNRFNGRRSPQMIIVDP